MSARSDVLQTCFPVRFVMIDKQSVRHGWFEWRRQTPDATTHPKPEPIILS